MNKRRVKCAVLLAGMVTLALAGACGMWLRSYRRQKALNRQLIDALLDAAPKQALALVNAGADPNTPVNPPPKPSLTDLWNHLIHRRAMLDTEMFSDNKLNAFEVACGAYEIGDMRWGLKTDEPHLVETMLQHGAQKDAKDAGGRTPLMWSIVSDRFKTVDVLLKHRVDVNARDNDGETALQSALFYPYSNDPSVRSKSANIVRHLLAHEADPNLTGLGNTPLQMAQNSNRPDLVALLQQAGAKK